MKSFRTFKRSPCNFDFNLPEGGNGIIHPNMKFRTEKPDISRRARESQTPVWRHDLSAYKAGEKTALVLTTIAMLNRAIGVIWNDQEFSGMPVDTPNGEVLFVPKQAVPLLRSKGIKFSEQPIIESSSGEKRAMHAKGCLA